MYMLPYSDFRNIHLKLRTSDDVDDECDILLFNYYWYCSFVLQGV